MALQPINAKDLVAKQHFAPETKFNILGGIQQLIEKGRADAGERRSLEATTAAAEGTASPEQIGLMFQQNPDRALKVLEGVGVRDKQQASNVAKAAFNIRNTPFAQRGPLIQQAAARIQQNGGDPSRILAMNNMSEQQQNETASVFEQASLSVAQRADQDLAERKFGLSERQVAAQERNVSSQIADRAQRTAITRDNARLDRTSTGKPTANMKDFEFYNRLKKNDPESAKQFGIKAGLVKQDGTELSTHLQKRLSTASDASIKGEADANRMLGLADSFESADVGGGFLSGKWAETLKDATGNQDSLSNLRREYASIKGGLVVENLPPGSASDVDIALALEGFPSANATGEQIASFMRGMAKLTKAKADFNGFKANYIAAKGHEKGMIKEWRQQIGGLSKPLASASLESITGDDILNMSTEELEKLMGQ